MRVMIMGHPMVSMLDEILFSTDGHKYVTVDGMSERHYIVWDLNLKDD